MNGGLHDQYNRAEVWTRGLACPFAKSDPDTHMSTDACKPDEGFKETRLLFEHIWRKHTRFFRCGFCSKRWSTSKSRKEVKERKEEHWENCEQKRRRIIYFKESEEDGSELLDWEQQKLLEQIKSTRDVKAKLKALYGACGKPVPETYYATPAGPAVQPQMPYGPAGEQPARNGGGFLDGFVPPPSEIPRPPRKRTTIINVSKANAVLQAGDSSEVSGANRSKDQDSGYASGPRNQGDTDDFPPTNGLPPQPRAFWLYEGRDNRVATAGPGRLTNDEDSFASIHDHAGHGDFRAYQHIDPVLYGDASSLSRRNDSLIDLDLSNTRAVNAGEPLNPLDFTDLEAEFWES